MYLSQSKYVEHSFWKNIVCRLLEYWLKNLRILNNKFILYALLLLLTLKEKLRRSICFTETTCKHMKVIFGSSYFQSCAFNRRRNCKIHHIQHLIHELLLIVPFCRQMTYSSPWKQRRKKIINNLTSVCELQ